MCQSFRKLWIWLHLRKKIKSILSSPNQKPEKLHLSLMNTCELGYDFIEQLSTEEEQNILDIHHFRVISERVLVSGSFQNNNTLRKCQTVWRLCVYQRPRKESVGVPKNSWTRLEGIIEINQRLQGIIEINQRLEGIIEINQRLEGIIEINQRLQGIIEINQRLQGIIEINQRL